MGILGAILGGIGAICAALGIVTILEVTTEPIISEHFTWGFWFALAAVLFLAAITSLVGRSPGQD
jgi:drug/metabolite transporter (DMT)-like permease